MCPPSTNGDTQSHPDGLSPHIAGGHIHTEQKGMLRATPGAADPDLPATAGWNWRLGTFPPDVDAGFLGSGELHYREVGRVGLGSRADAKPKARAAHG